MAHFCLLAATPTPEALHETLLPFWNDDREGRQQPHFVFVEDRHADIDPSAGRRGYWRNPIGKCDGWVTGGNFTGLLDGADQCRAAQLAQALAGDPHMLAPVHALLRESVWRDAEELTPWSERQWRAEVQAFVAALAPEAWVTIVDCHC